MLKLMSITPRQYFLIGLLVFLVACGNEPVALPTETPIQTVVSPTPIPTSTLIPATEFSTPLPPQPTIAFITPDASQVERWKEYEDELAKLVLSNSGADFPRYEDALCEWDVLGRSGQDIYVWAECSVPGSGGRGPAVIYLEEDGSIRDVKYAFPSPSRDVAISRLFPEDIQAKIYTYFSSEWQQELQRHLTYRLTHPEEPPLVILSATLDGTSTPYPTHPIIAVFTPDAIQVERWKEYQTELARVILAANPEIGNDPEIYKTALCEWDILGQSGQEVYVYSVCVGVTANGNRDMRKPAIIYLEPNGSIQNAKIPEPKGPDSEMFNYDPFPKDVQEKFCYYFDPFPSDLPQCPYPYLSGSPRPRVDEMYAHIRYRMDHPGEPPLVVPSIMPTATSTP